MYRIFRKLLVSLMLFMLLLPLSVRTEDRGRMLYQNHCIACHESTVHIRAGTKAKQYADIEKFARRFSKLAGVDWNDSDMTAVVEYLNRKYYKFDR